jgi:hypothetical protein
MVRNQKSHFTKNIYAPIRAALDLGSHYGIDTIRLAAISAHNSSDVHSSSYR